MTSVSVNAGNVHVSVDLDQGSESSTEGMTQLEKLASLKGPLDFLQDSGSGKEVPDFAQGKEGLDLEGGIHDLRGDVTVDLADLAQDLGLYNPAGENTVTLNDEEYVIPEGTTSVTVEDGQVLADGKPLVPTDSLAEDGIDFDTPVTKPVFDVINEAAGATEPSETISFMGGEQTPISADTEIDGSSITVDGQTFEMNLHLTREYDTSLPLINGFEIPPEVGYTVNEDGVAEFYVMDDVVQNHPDMVTSTNDDLQVNAPVFAPVENIDNDADIGSITYSKDQSQNV